MNVTEKIRIQSKAPDVFNFSCHKRKLIYPLLKINKLYICEKWLQGGQQFK